MTTTMDTTHIPTLIQMADYVIGSNAISLHCQNKTELDKAQYTRALDRRRIIPSHLQRY